MATYTLGRVGIVAKGEYSSSTSYAALDMVTYQGSSYIAKASVSGIVPTNTSYWMLAARGAYTAAVAAGYGGSEAQFQADLALLRTLESQMAGI